MKVTAYVPCYNARSTIGATLRSIVDQTFTVSEIFMIDDGSTDGSEDASEVKVIRFAVNKGRGAARARAMAEARHDLVLGCDATLTLDSHFLEHALPWFAGDQVAAVFGQINESSTQTVANRWRARHLFQSHLPHQMAHFASLATYCCVVRKSAAQQVGGFNPALRAGEDSDLGQRLLRAGFDVVFDPNLRATSVVGNSVMEILERYARWNSSSRISFISYLRQLSYAWKVMAVKDLRARDPLGACISLLAPHYQFWRAIAFSGSGSSTFREEGRGKDKEMKNLKSLAWRVINNDRRQQLRRAIARGRHFGLAHYCPCCKAHIRRFTPFPLDPNPEAGCPVCGSLERHRLIWLYMTQKTDLFDGNHKKMLHVAPEPQLSRLFQKAAYIDYLSADLSAANAMVQMDITDIHYSDNTFDVVYCSHVLEHVPNDRRAMGEFRRVLKPNGWAILQVPITADITFEDPAVITPEAREQLFGQYDHVRRYGPDYKDRLTDAGFSVVVDEFVRKLDAGTVRRFGLRQGEEVYFCGKKGMVANLPGS
jgi:glycosyltransferase involved in cell wall biosynthesis